MRVLSRLAVCLVTAGPGIGCMTCGPVNPSFPVSVEAAEAALDAMARQPARLERPVVVLSGYLDPGAASWWVGRSLRRACGDPRFLEVQFAGQVTFDGCRARLIHAVDAAFPSADSTWTTEVDVVGVSMGGLVARTAAAPPEAGAVCGRRLRIRRLFTISSPHRGASLARIPCFLPLHRDMRPGSSFLRRLRHELRGAEYTLFAYVRLRDWTVGAENTAPDGEAPWWLNGSILTPPHLASAADPRIHADIARRLRGEEPFATQPPAPLPAYAPAPASPGCDLSPGSAAAGEAGEHPPGSL